MELNKYIHEKMRIYLNVFNIFQGLMNPRKSSCDVPSGTTQGWVYFKINVQASIQRRKSLQAAHVEM
jgi:hypothetical protein